MRRFGLIVAVILTGCNSNGGPVPSQPAYDVDVRPILMAHCARCHGAGGTLNVPTEPTGPDAAVLPNLQGPVGVAFKSLYCFLDRFDNGGDCMGDGGLPTASCQRGAAYWASIQELKITIQSTSGATQMPPPPAPRLDDWEMQTIDNWSAETPPICSHSASPDPSICPNGP